MSSRPTPSPSRLSQTKAESLVARDGALRGYVASSIDGQGGAVRWDHSDAPGTDQVVFREYTVSAPAFAPTPIVKRTEDERLDSLTRRLVHTYEDTGYLPPEGLSDVQIEYWKQGKPISTDEIRQVAAHYLNKNERKSA